MIADPRAFAYWLQGYSEICGKCPTEEQWAMIKEHLQLVFTKVTSGPAMPTWSPGDIGVDDNGRMYPPHEMPTYCTSAPANGDRLCGSALFKPNWPLENNVPETVILHSTDHTC